MANLPAAFSEYTRQLMGEERFGRYLKSFEEEAPVSIRLNPMKIKEGRWQIEDAEHVPWCRNGYYLKQRPNFTFDPLFHAGCYYVQEAASMFLDEIIRQLLHDGSKFFTLHSSLFTLDLCAAPGGKSTLLRSALPNDCVLYSNEPIRNRANILLENVTKWGYANHYVTNVYPEAYRKSKHRFDVILCDVPCSGEGMFRKDEATIREWSPQQVEKCWQLQRDIVTDAWACLNDGGLLIYSTCTFNTKENEENIRWILDSFKDAKVLDINTKQEWNITESLLEGFHEPVYRFIPGISRSEGLFVCVLRKGSELEVPTEQAENSHAGNKKFPRREQSIPTLGTIPLHVDGPQVELTYQQAMAYLRHEALVLPEETPRGLVNVAFQGFPLGPAKNIGSRANNLYPKEWKIKTTHIPNDYEPILKRL
jgi:16S rRNA C967 or C1407 C5-methylase (RsmB/RsmF family)